MQRRNIPGRPKTCRLGQAEPDLPCFYESAFSGNQIRPTPTSGARNARPKSDFCNQRAEYLRGVRQSLTAAGGHARRLSLYQNKARKVLKYPIIL